MPLTLGPLPDDDRWDALVGACPEAGFMQASRWASLKRAEGFTVHGHGLWDGETLVGGGLLYGFDGPVGMLVCPEGPVLPWDDTPTARAGLRLLLDAARDHGALGLRIEPHLVPPRPSLLRNWQRAPVDLTPAHTLVLDLSLTDDAFRAQMKPKGRYNVRVAARHGVTVRESTAAADMPVFYRLFQETAVRSKLFAEPYSFFLNLAAAWFPSGLGSLFVAEWEGEALAAVIVVRCGPRATYLYGGSTQRARHVMPCYALHDAAATALRARGCTEYDLYGYDPFEHPAHLYAGISRFKRQFGGVSRSFIGAYDHLFYDRLAEQIVAAAAD